MRPEIAVLIAAQQGDAQLSTLLASLEAQTLPRTGFEVVMVGDDSAALGAQAVRTFPQDWSGVSAALNVAVFAATAPILAIAPASQSLAPDFLEHLLAAHGRWSGEGDVVFARLTAPAGASPLVRFLAEEAAPHAWRAPYNAFSCKRELLASHGLFDERFADGWERAELLWRLRTRRVRLRQAEDAHVLLKHDVSFAEECARRERQGRAHAHLAAVHDDLLVRAHAEIGAALALWAARGAAFADVCAAAEARGAYARAFALCWAKGVAAAIAAD